MTAQKAAPRCGRTATVRCDDACARCWFAAVRPRESRDPVEPARRV